MLTKRLYLLVISALLLLTAILLPAIPFPVKSYDYVFMLDITKSMNVMDYSDKQGAAISRLEKAKGSMLAAVQSLPCGSKVGLGIFTERMPALLYSPIDVCDDYSVLQASIAKLDWRMAWVADSNISLGLYNILQLMQNDKLVDSQLVFFTDGQEAPPVNPRYAPDYEELFEQPDKPKQVGLIIGVGQKSLSKIPKFDEDGNQIGFYKIDDVPHSTSFGLPEDPSKVEGYIPRNGPWGNKKVVGTEHLSSVKEAYLKQLADKAHMAYFHLLSDDGLADRLLEPHLSHQQVVPTSFNHYFALLSLFCLLLCFFNQFFVVKKRVG